LGLDVRSFDESNKQRICYDVYHEGPPNMQ
jgi:hypothetical protein